MATHVTNIDPGAITAATFTAGAYGDGVQPAYVPFVGDADDIDAPIGIGANKSPNAAAPGSTSVPGEGGPGSTTNTVG